jgi:hypothetical protein
MLVVSSESRRNIDHAQQASSCNGTHLADMHGEHARSLYLNGFQQLLCTSLHITDTYYYWQL